MNVRKYSETAVGLAARWWMTKRVEHHARKAMKHKRMAESWLRAVYAVKAADTIATAEQVARAAAQSKEGVE